MPSTGDILVTARDLSAPWLPTGEFYSSAAYPELSVYLDQDALFTDWTTATGVFGTDEIRAATYGGGLWLVTGPSGLVATSGDGVSWSEVDTGAGSGVILFSAAYRDGLYIVGGTAAALRTSPDGVVWTGRTLPFDGASFNALGLASNGSQVVCVGNGGQLAMSSTGTSWFSRTSNTANALRAAAHGDGLWVAVGNSGTIITSTDTATWVVRTSGVSATLYGVAYHNGLWVVVGNGGTLLTSPDGATWTPRTIPAGVTTLYNVTNVAGLWAAGGPGGTIITSEDGVSWADESYPAYPTYHTIRAFAVHDVDLKAVVGGSGGTINMTRGAPAGQFWVPPVADTTFYNSYIYAGA